jgi:hypothetical protein
VVTADEPPPHAVSEGDGTGAAEDPRNVRELAVVANEFAAVRVSLDTNGNGPRLLVEDTENGARIWLSPLELASLCLAGPEDRVGWLKVGLYRDGGP